MYRKSFIFKLHFLEKNETFDFNCINFNSRLDYFFNIIVRVCIDHFKSRFNYKSHFN